MTKYIKLAGALVAFLVGVLISIVLIRWLTRQRELPEDYAVRISDRRPTDLQIPVPLPPEPEAVQVAEAKERLAAPARKAKAPSAGDDLLAISGIGPAYAKALNALGIKTYKQLGKQDPDALAVRLREQGARIIGDRIRNEDWIGQASRLAAGKG